MSRLPMYAVCSPDAAEQHAEATRRGTYNLIAFEENWRERQAYLQDRGYELRSRYHPDWKPSWIGTNRVPTFCEDSIHSPRSHILDATRRKDGKLVFMKTVHAAEVAIARYLSSEASLKDPRNHCVPILDVLPDPLDNDMYLMVMPYLRPLVEPPFGAIGEVIDCIQQTLEGLCFIHSQGVAHRDCAAGNIMMDGSPLYPQGHHPIRLDYTADGIYDAIPLSRTDRPVRYFFIDFGLSSYFRPGEPHLVLGQKGRDKDPPELSDEIPYNPFHLDIFLLGNVYNKEFFQKYHGLDLLRPLIEAMTNKEASLRPTAEAALTMFQEMRSQLGTGSLRRRLRSRTEWLAERVAYDAAAAAREGILYLKHLVR